MAIEYDPKKDALNVAKHGISLARAVDLRIVVLVPDQRFDYGEIRFNAFGYIEQLAYCFCFVERDGKKRAISLRRARQKELERYAQGKENSN